MATRAATVSFLLLLAMGVCLVEAKPFGKLKQTDMVFYVQDWQTGFNITTVPIAATANSTRYILEFGTLFAIDCQLTEGFNRNTTAQVGRARGIYVQSALDGSDLHFMISLVFTNKKYNGSSLEIQGANKLLQKYRELSVVSGTGKFRFARGYVQLETVYLDLPGSNAIIQWNATVFHY